MRTTPARSPSSGVEALLTPNRLNNATHHHDGENTPTTNNNNRQQSGGRKAKAPLKSPLAVVGLLSPNDDTLERQQSMKKRQTVSAFRRELSKNVEKQLENIDVANLSSSSSDEEEDDGVGGDQLARSRRIGSEGLDGLIPRGSQLFTLGATSFLAFGPFILFVLVRFGAVWLVWGDLFVHGGSVSSGPPVYYDPYDLLAEPTADPMIPM